MDVAASEFLTEDKKYDLDFKTPKNDGSKKLTGNLQMDGGVIILTLLYAYMLKKMYDITE